MNEGSKSRTSYLLVLIAKRQLPSHFWKSTENRKKFMNEIANKLNIKKPNEWGKVTLRRIYELGGSSLLAGYFNNSLFSCLQATYQGMLSVNKINFSRNTLAKGVVFKSSSGSKITLEIVRES